MLLVATCAPRTAAVCVRGHQGPTAPRSCQRLQPQQTNDSTTCNSPVERTIQTQNLHTVTLEHAAEGNVCVTRSWLSDMI
jgi:hypothetical protein